MDHPLGDAFVIEVEDLFLHRENFRERRAWRVGPQRFLVVGDHQTLRRGQAFAIAFGVLLDFTTGHQSVTIRRLT